VPCATHTFAPIAALHPILSGVPLAHVTAFAILTSKQTEIQDPQIIATTVLPPLVTTTPIHRFTTFHALCVIIGQTLMCASTFFWNEDGRYSINGAVIIILSMVFWAVGLQGVFSLFNEKNPWYARIGMLYAMYGCFGGAGFGFEGLYSSILPVGNKIGVAAYEKFPMQMNLALFWSGPAFPLSMLVLGIFLIVRKFVSPLTGVLIIIGAIAFPLSRISRIDWIAHIADFVLLAGVTSLAFTLNRPAQTVGTRGSVPNA
jgi:hypothetical protein